jgi:hypothetical protein
LLGIFVSNFLLTNSTAPNPTGSRYSSDIPLTTGQGSSSAIGKSGEDILAKDLGLPNNNLSGQIQCICGNASQVKSNQCNACLVTLPSLSTYRRPDFVGSGFLAESKNEQGLWYSGREVDQINDYVLAAILMRVQLWVYVRVNTEIASEFVYLVESTGGGVVRYFTIPGYVDPLETLLYTIFGISCLTLGGIIFIFWFSSRFKNRTVVVSFPSPTPKPPRQPKPSGDPVSKAVRKTDNAEDFMQRSKEKRRQDIEKEDSRDD